MTRTQTPAERVDATLLEFAHTMNTYMPEILESLRLQNVDAEARQEIVDSYQAWRKASADFLIREVDQRI